MRNTRDRIRHAIFFEIIGLIIVTPLVALVFDMHSGDIGVVAVVSATIAMMWNYVFNLLFDRAMVWRRGSTAKTVVIRVFHAVLFELGLLVVLLPFIAWYLAISVTQALLMDLSFAGFYVVYAFVFNWGYDLVFPVPERA